MKRLHASFLVLLLLSPVAAQSKARLQRELRSKETAAKGDPDALFEVARWAGENGLVRAHRRVLQAVLRLDPDHEKANLALGNVRYDGKWMDAERAAELRRKALEKEFRERGMVEIGGVWVKKEHREDAKRGIFHHEGELVTRDELRALQSDRVRHPRTGRLIPAADADRAEDGFLVDGSWVGEAEANLAHSREGNPWVVRSDHATVLGNEPIEEMIQLARVVDQGIREVRGYFEGRPHPELRPVVWLAGTTAHYRSLGEDFGTGGSAALAFLSEQPVSVPNLEGNHALAVSNLGEEAWAEYFARHAGAMAYTRAMGDSVQARLPAWFERGMGGVASHHQTDWQSKQFGQLIVDAGGLGDLASWFRSFGISGEMSGNEIQREITTAGLMIRFAVRGGHPPTKEAMQELTAAFGEDARAVESALQRLERQLVSARDELEAYLQQLVQG